MPSDDLILAFDTSAAHCAAALLSGPDIMQVTVDPRDRGQAEHLMPLLKDMLDRAGTSWTDLTRIGVGVGPGNFTGIRIAVSAARGLALGLGIPAIGVSTFDAIHYMHPDETAAVAAPRDMIYAKRPGQAPSLLPAAGVADAVFATDVETMITAMAHCTAQADPVKTDRPKPLYIKPADAAPSRDAAPVILS